MRLSILFAVLATVAALLCPAPAAAIELDPIEKIGGTENTCGTTAAALDDADVPDSEHRHIQICNRSGNVTVFVKSSPTVTLLNGVPIKPGDCYETGRKLKGGKKMYCITTAASKVVVSEAK